MFVLPYFHAIRKTPEKSIHFLYLFLGNNATNLIHIEGAPETFCQENDLPISEVYLKNSIAFVKVNTTTFDHSAFYTFHEDAPDGAEVWKTFLWIQDDNGSDPWNTNDTFKTIKLNTFVLHELLETILRHDA